MNKDRINVKTPKKLWLLRSYIKYLNFFVALILIGYIGFSIYNLFGSGSTILSFLIGAGGVYIVLVSLSVLLVAQTIMLFIGIHDNVDDIRKKTLDPEFMVDLTAEKQKDQSNALNSLFLLVVICLAILCSILNMTVGVEVKNKREYVNSQNSVIENNNSENDISKSTETKKEIDIADFLGSWHYELENGWFFNFEVQRDKILYQEYRMGCGYEILLPRINKDMNWISLDFYQNECSQDIVNSQNCNNSVGYLKFLNGDLCFVVGDGDPCGRINNNNELGVFKSGNVLKLEKFLK